MIQTHFSVSEAEYIEAQKWIHRAAMPRVIRYRVLLILLCIASIVLTLELATDKSLWIPIFFALLPSLLLIYSTIKCSFRNPALRKEYPKAAQTLSNQTVTIDSECYHSETPGESVATLYWKTFSSWTEAPSVFILVRGALLYLIPKSALTPEQLTELRQLCTTHIQPRP